MERIALLATVEPVTSVRGVRSLHYWGEDRRRTGFEATVGLIGSLGDVIDLNVNLGGGRWAAGVGHLDEI